MTVLRHPVSLAPDPLPPGRDVPTFTCAECLAAFRLVLPEAEAVREAEMLSEPGPSHDEEGMPWFPPGYAADPRVYTPDLLSLLALGSATAAVKTWRLLGVSAAEGAARQARLRQALGTG